MIWHRTSLIVFLFPMAWCWTPSQPALAASPEVQTWIEALASQAVTWHTDGRYEIPHLGPITADGTLEPAWHHAMAVRLPYDISRGRNAPAPVETLVLVGITDEAFVVAFLCHDPNPDHMRVSITDRDRAFRDDFVGVLLDTFGDQRHAYIVFVNPRNVQMDGLRSEPGGEDFNFDFLWESGTRRVADGYVVEIRIPFRQIRFRVDADGWATWRVAFFRNYPRDYRYQIVPVKVDFNRNCVLCQFPTVRFPIERHPRSLVQVLPYGRDTLEETGHDRVHDAALGLDVKFQPSPAWMFDVTLNPDFSQVETDVFQITTNIRFAPFYPEKRPFFMERSDLFRTPLRILYTRTVLEPYYGFRLTGKTGRHTMALLHVMDRQTLLWFPGVQTSRSTILNRVAWATVLRYRYDLGAQSTLGLLLTDKEYRVGFNRVVAFDGQWYLSQRLLLQTQAVGTWTAYPSDVAESFSQPSDDFFGWGTRFVLIRSGRSWNMNIGWHTMSDDFRADLGFIQQVGFHRTWLHHWLALWPDHPWIQNLGIQLDATVTWDQVWRQQEHNASLGVFISGIGQSSLFVQFRNRSERVGDVLFHLNDAFASLHANPASWLSFSLTMAMGQGVDLLLARRVRQWAGFWNTVWRPWEGLQVTVRTVYRRLYERTTVQDAWIQHVRLEWQITPSLAFRQIVQWLQYRFPAPQYREAGFPTRQRVWEAQSLVRYRWNYATALYVGFYGQWQTSGEMDFRRNWSVFAKVSYLFNLAL